MFGGKLHGQLRLIKKKTKGNFEDNKIQSQFMYSLNVSTNVEGREKEKEKKRESMGRMGKVHRESRERLRVQANKQI